MSGNISVDVRHVTSTQSEEHQFNTRRKMSSKLGPPRNLKIACWNESHVFLKWKSPATDGVFPVIKYSLEVLDGKWKQEKEVRNEMASIKYVEGRIYQFRVLAVNEVGPGEPSNIIPFTAPNRSETAVNEVKPGESSNVTTPNRSEIAVNEDEPQARNITPFIVANRREIVVNEVGLGEPSNIISLTVPKNRKIDVKEVGPGEPSDIIPFAAPNRSEIAVHEVEPKESSTKAPLTVPKYTDIVIGEVRLGEPSNKIPLTAPKNMKIAVKEVGPEEPSDIIPFTAPNHSETAVNEDEPGEPSSVTPFKFKGGPPRIHHASFETVEVKVDESYEFKRFVEAEPSAIVTWKLDGQHIENGDRMEITYDNLFARIKIPECKVDDGGVYSITAINEFGQLEQNLFELVVDEGVKGVLKKVGSKPGKPRDLQVAFSNKTHVFLKWKRPESDGGSPVYKYVIQALDKLGNWKKEREVPSNEEITCVKYRDGGIIYQFRVIAVNDAGPGEPSNVTSFSVSKRKEDAVKDVMKKVGIAAACTAGASAVILGGIAVAVPAIGFTAGGVAAGSLAAAYQSAFLGGTIVSGSAFATLQSIGAAGLAISTKAGIIAATGATSFFSVFVKKKPQNITE